MKRHLLVSTDKSKDTGLTACGIKWRHRENMVSASWDTTQTTCQSCKNTIASAEAEKKLDISR